MKYYLEITLLNGMILNTPIFQSEYAQTIPDTILYDSKDRAQAEASTIFVLDCYTIGDITFPTSRIDYITLKSQN